MYLEGYSSQAISRARGFTCENMPELFTKKNKDREPALPSARAEEVQIRSPETAPASL
jgi:hypothetical protein